MYILTYVYNNNNELEYIIYGVTHDSMDGEFRQTFMK